MGEARLLRCIDDSNQKVLKLGKIYTEDCSNNTHDDRIYIQEWKRFPFLKNRFEYYYENKE